MYIHPYWLGVLTTVLVLVIGLVALGAISIHRDKKGRK